MNKTYKRSLTLLGNILLINKVNTKGLQIPNATQSFQKKIEKMFVHNVCTGWIWEGISIGMGMSGGWGVVCPRTDI